MHDIEPFYGWQKYYLPYEDTNSPFFNKEVSSEFQNSIYDFYIHPDWDEIGSETLYCKVLSANYHFKFVVIELIGEWNDTLHNDIMYLKRHVVDRFIKAGINKFIILGENVLNFHGGDDDYYEEWFEDVEDGWIAAVNFRPFVLNEFSKYKLDFYLNYGGTLQFENWRTLKPEMFFNLVNNLIFRRLA